MHTKEDAVSPVVGVLLMLVVTIIIAAVVSGFAGGLVSGQQKAPSISIKPQLINSGYYHDTAFVMEVTGVSEPIPTKDLKIVTQWSHNATVSGGNVTQGNVINYQYYTASTTGVAPIGFGSGVGTWSIYNNVQPEQQFGNYTLTGGSIMRCYPAGPFSTLQGGYGQAAGRYLYDYSGSVITSGQTDTMMAVLGSNWYWLRPGDVVSVKLVHVPTGATIYDGKVPVEGQV